MKSEKPKQFLPLAGKPLLEYSLQAFASVDASLRGGLVLVSHPDYQMACDLILQRYVNEFSYCSIVPGGETRHDSSRNGMQALKELDEQDMVMIHDGARPMVTLEEIGRLYGRLQKGDVGCATLCRQATETFAVSSSISSIVEQVPDRSTLYSIKTPQAMKAVYASRFCESTKSHYTDLISWALSEGIPSGLVEAGPDNIKVTTPEDLNYLKSILAQSGSSG